MIFKKAFIDILLTPLSINFSSKCYLLFEKVSIFCKFFLASHVCIQTAECTSSASSQSYSTIDIVEQALSILGKHKESQWCFCCHCSHFRLLRYLLSRAWVRGSHLLVISLQAQERVLLLCTCKVSNCTFWEVATLLFLIMINNQGQVRSQVEMK